MELSARDMPIYRFLAASLSKYSGILTKRAVCIDIKEIAKGHISSDFFGPIRMIT